MKEKSIFLDYVGDNPRMRILNYLIEGQDFDYTLTDMLNANVSWGTLNTLIPKLLKLNIIIKTRKVGRATLYKINKENPFVKKLIEIDNALIIQDLKKRSKQKIEISA